MIDVLLSIAEQAEKTPAQVALNWVLNRPGVTSPIIGARTINHLEDNLGTIGWKLCDDHMKMLNEVSSEKLPYPYNWLD